MEEEYSELMIRLENRMREGDFDLISFFYVESEQRGWAESKVREYQENIKRLEEKGDYVSIDFLKGMLEVYKTISKKIGGELK